MSRVKRGVAAKARHKKVIKLAKGYRHGRKNVYRQAKQAVLKAGSNAYRGRKLNKRSFRSLWIVRINAACKQNGIKYSRLIKYMNEKKLDLNRKNLSLMAKDNPKDFESLAKKVNSSQP